MFHEFINRFLSRYIIYTKVIQWINFDFLSFLGKDFSNFMRKFTDNAPYVEEDIDYESLNKLNILGMKYSITVDKVPINSGTVSLVFKGQINEDGNVKKIAIKVLRKNIRKRIDECINTLTFIFSWIMIFPLLKSLNLDILLDDVKEDLLEQTNFKKEAENIKLVDMKLKKYRNVKTIKLIEDLTFDNLIVMEFIEGKSIFNMTEEEKSTFNVKLISSLFHVKFKKCIFHLDLHPGNILYTNDSKIVLLDLGILIEISVDECNFMIDFLKIINSDNIEEILTSIFLNYKDILFRDEIKNHNFVREIMIMKPDLFTKKDNVSFVNDTKFLISKLSELNCKVSKRFNKLIFGIISFINIFTNMGEDMYSIIIKNIKNFDN